MPRRVAPEEQVRFLTLVEPILDQLGHHETLEDGPAGCMVVQVLGRSDSEQVAEEAGVEEVELGALDQALAEVSVVRPQQMNDKTRLQDRDPSTGGGVGDAAVNTKRGKVQELSTAPRAEPNETSKGLQIADVQNLAHIPLHVGLVVAAQPLLRIQSLVVNPGVEPTEQDPVHVPTLLPSPSRDDQAELVDGKWTPLAKFREREGQQVEDGTTSGQRLAHLMEQEEVLGTRQNEPSGLVVRSTLVWMYEKRSGAR